MSNITIPDDPSVILPILNSLKKTYFTGKTRQLSFRKAQLKSFLLGLTELKQDFQEALAKDLGYSPFMTEFLSQYLVKSELSHSIKNFEKWTKKINVSTPVLLSPACSSIIPEPYGVALVIGAWNYPFVTSLQPVISAIAAGNCCVLKPSEMAPYSSNVMKKLFDKYLDKDCYQVIEGQINVAIKITTLPFDLIIFTGSPEKGRLVAKAAAENLVPCILELGGKSPTIVDEGVNLQNAALRITQGRFFNCGQTCIAPDYVLVQKNVKEAFTKEIIKTLKSFYNEEYLKNPDYTRIISEFHVERLEKLLDVNNHKGKILIGGKVDKKNKLVEPTIIDSPIVESKLMTEEIFGPILPMIEFDKIEEVIEFINKRPKPLVIYYYGPIFGANKNIIRDKTSSGAFSSNESLFHMANSDLPFGGVQNSGHSKIHGYEGFKNCSHMKSCLESCPLNVYPISCRFPPFTNSKSKTILKMMSMTEGITMECVLKGFILFIFALIFIFFILPKIGSISSFKGKSDL